MPIMTENAPRVLLVDDEETVLFAYSLALRRHGITQVLTSSSGEDAMKRFSKEPINVVLLDLTMPGISGQELLRHLAEQFPHIPVIVMTGIGDIESVVSCMKWGAFDYLVKPVDEKRLITTVMKAFEFFTLKSEIDSLKHHLLDENTHKSACFDLIKTVNRKMKQLFRYAEAVAASSQPVLITGETGVGKELIAKAIHESSGRTGPFIAVNISGLDDNVFSDTLFGHLKGAFTGADSMREGLLLRAAGGTLFLDEIGDLDMKSQLKLLRLLQEREYYQLGSDTPRLMQARIVVATNRNLPEMIAGGTFRNDLYFRLCSHEIVIPPLRERINDLPLLLEHFLAISAAELNKKIPPIDPELLQLLAQYDFPGNVRELKGMVHNAVAQHSRGALKIASFRLPAVSGEIQAFTPLNVQTLVATAGVSFTEFPTLGAAEERLIAEALSRANGSQTKAAAALGITRQALSQRLLRKKVS